jgi:CHAP domain
MSLEAVLARIGQLQSTFTPPATAPSTAAPATTSFASALQSAGAAGATAPLPAGAPAATLGAGPPAATLAATAPAATLGATAPTAPTGAGQAILNAVRREVGVKEQPPGSNDSPRIAQFRQATAGSGVGPWCAYFASWAARQAGVPLGEHGQGFGRVDDVYAWAQRSGKAIPNGAGVKPQPGDLIVWDEHIGVVESVDRDGSIHTIEGNSSDQVSQRTYGADGGHAIGYVRLG